MGAKGAAAVGMAGVSLLQFGLQRSAAEIERAEAETSANAEELGAKQREADRKGRLSAALASQNAEAGAKGVAAFEGSPLAIMDADIALEQEATQRDVFQTKLKSEALRSSGKIRGRHSKIGANIGLLSGVGSAAMVGWGGGK